MQVRQNPYMPSNKLSEFCCEANASRRRQILKDVKKPSDFKAPRYGPAQNVISEIIVQKTTENEMIFRQLRRIQEANISTKWRRERKQSNLSAVEHFLQIAPNFFLEGIEFKKADNSQPHLNYSGVAVSVRPEILLTARNKKGEIVHGAVKLYMSKGYSFKEEAGLYAATLVHQHLLHNQVVVGKINHELCFAIDVFQEKIFVSPKNQKRLVTSLEAGCQEIAYLWPNIQI